MIKRVWILKDGQPLVTKSYDPAGDGGFQATVTALIGQAISGQKKEELEGDLKLTYTLEDNLFFIIVSDPDEAGIIALHK